MIEQASPDTGAFDTGITLDQAVERYTQQHSADAEPPADEPDAPDRSEVPDDTHQDDPQDDGEADEAEASQADENDDEDDNADEGEEDPDQTDDDDLDRKIKVKIDGKEREVTLRELRDGYSFHARNARESQRIADERKAVEAERQTAAQMREQLHQERLYIKSLADTVKSALTSHLPSPEQMEQIRVRDPQRYLLMRDEIDRARNYVSHIDQQALQILQRGQAELAQQTQAQLQERTQRILDEMPELRDREKARTFVQKTHELLAEAGFQEQEIRQVSDPRVLKFAKLALDWRADAEAYRKLQAKKPAVEKRVSEAPRTARPGTAQSAKDVARSRVQDLTKRASKTGRLDDVVSAYLAQTGA